MARRYRFRCCSSAAVAAAADTSLGNLLIKK